jgi:hypothetical protein
MKVTAKIPTRIRKIQNLAKIGPATIKLQIHLKKEMSEMYKHKSFLLVMVYVTAAMMYMGQEVIRNW